MRGEEVKESLGEQLIVYMKLMDYSVKVFYDSVLIEGEKNFLLRNPYGMFIAEHGENFTLQTLIERDIGEFRKKLLDLL